MKINILQLIMKEMQNGYSEANASAKVCQDLVLKALAEGPLSRNVTIKGGVVMRSRTGNIRRATQDLDIDFIRYSLAEESIDAFVRKLNCISGITFIRTGSIDELRQQDYHGKRIYILIRDTAGNEIKGKIDLGVHRRFEIAQEEYCFDISLNEEGASLLINSFEQMFSEKLSSLLKFGALSTRYKDVFDIYYLIDKIDARKLSFCFRSYIFDDPGMKENNMKEVVKRVQMTFQDKVYRRNLEFTDKNWLGEDIGKIADGIITCLSSLEDGVVTFGNI